MFSFIVIRQIYNLSREADEFKAGGFAEAPPDPKTTAIYFVKIGAKITEKFDKSGIK